ncbi:MAG: flagellar hook-length control protein FliK [Lachnospiraceae bacterium]|nr:flagellar hook-length control protein FliK [Lachnospiraceae bacterium]
MVTQSIKTSGYLYMSSGAGKQTEVKTQESFSEAIGKAENQYKKSPEKQVKKETVQPSVDEKQKQNPVKETQEPSEEVQEVMAAVVNEQVTQQVQQEIAETLNVSTEDVQNMMETLQMDVMDLQDSQNLLKLMVSLKELKGPEEIITNQELSETFKTLDGQVKNLLETFHESHADTKEAVQVNDLSADVEHEDVSVQKQEAKESQDNNQEMSQNQGEREPLSGKENKVTVTKETGQQLNVTGNQNIFQNIQETLSERVDAHTSENIVRQVIEQVNVQLKSDVTSLEMQLYPEHLGKVSIQVTSKNGALTAQIAAESEAARAALESQINVLKDTLNQQGLKVESVEVLVSSHGFDKNNESESDNKEQRSKNRKTGKVILDETLEAEVLEEDESLKETIGNTVSYTA